MLSTFLYFLSRLLISSHTKSNSLTSWYFHPHNYNLVQAIHYYKLYLPFQTPTIAPIIRTLLYSICYSQFQTFSVTTCKQFLIPSGHFPFHNGAHCMKNIIGWKIIARRNFRLPGRFFIPLFFHDLMHFQTKLDPSISMDKQPVKASFSVPVHLLGFPLSASAFALPINTLSDNVVFLPDSPVSPSFHSFLYRLRLIQL